MLGTQRGRPHEFGGFLPLGIVDPFGWVLELPAVDSLLLAWPCSFLGILHSLGLRLGLLWLLLEADLPLHKLLHLILCNLLRLFGPFWTIFGTAL